MVSPSSGAETEACRGGAWHVVGSSSGSRPVPLPGRLAAQPYCDLSFRPTEARGLGKRPG